MWPPPLKTPGYAPKMVGVTSGNEAQKVNNLRNHHNYEMKLNWKVKTEFERESHNL